MIGISRVTVPTEFCNDALRIAFVHLTETP